MPVNHDIMSVYCNVNTYMSGSLSIEFDKWYINPVIDMICCMVMTQQFKPEFKPEVDSGGNLQVKLDIVGKSIMNIYKLIDSWSINEALQANHYSVSMFN